MKALKDNCVMTNLDVDLSKENNRTLKNFFENNRIIALFDIPEGSASHFSEPFKLHSKSVMYSPFFIRVSVKGNTSFFVYVTKSLLNKGNVIKLANDYYTYDGSEFERTEKPGSLAPCMEGIFGFRVVQVGTVSLPVEKCYPAVISSQDAHYHLVPEKENTVIHMIAELPPRYSVEAYFDNVKEIAKSILPQSLEIEVSLSSTVRKRVR